MRKDIAIYVKYAKEKELMNKSEIARKFGCDRKTVNKYIKDSSIVRKSREYKSKLNGFEGIIIDKADNCFAKATAIHNFIKKQGYTGGYLTVNNFVKKHKKNEIKKATIRFETSPGLQAQVDWKEKFKLVNKEGEVLEVNIFLMILGYSRLKFVKLTDNKTQKTLFECMYNGFEYFQGVPKEILFDNMKTVVDHENSTFKNVVINKKFKSFSKEAGFEVITCRAYRPQTKGYV